MEKDEQYDRAVLLQKMKLLRGETALEAASGSRESKRLDLDGCLLPRDFESTENPLREAVEVLAVLARAFPRRPEAHYYHARGLALLGRDADALEALEGALARNPEFLEFLPARVLREELDGGPVEKPGSPDAWLERHPNAKTWQVWLEAYRAAKEKRWEEAATSYGELIALEDDAGELYLGSSLDFRLGRGIALLEVKEYWRAAEDFVVARQRWPNFLEPALLLARAYALAGNEDGIRTTFERLYREAQSRENGEEAAIWIAVVCASLGRMEQTLAWAERAGRSSIRERLRAWAQLRLLRPDESVRAAQRAVALDPEDAVALYVRASHLYWNHRFRRGPGREAELREVVRLCSEAIELDRGSARAYALLSCLHEERDDFREALTLCETALETAPDDFEVQRWCVIVQLWVGPLEAARRFLESILERADELPPYHGAWWTGMHALLLDLQGREDEAIVAYRSALAIDPRNHFAWGYLGEIYAERGDYEIAVQLFRSHLSEVGARVKSYVAHGGLARSLEHLGRFDEAVRAWAEAIRDDPSNREAHDGLLGILRRRATTEATTGLESLVDELKELSDSPALPPFVHRTLAFLRVHVPGRRDLERARERIARSRETEPPVDAETLALTAEIAYADGEPETALRTLERAVRSPGASQEHARLLEALRVEVGKGESADEAPAALLSPKESGDSSEPRISGDQGDARWLLEQLARGEVVRLNCGGGELLDHAGKPWGRDRFFRGGSSPINRTRLRGVADEPLHRDYRVFASQEYRPGYRLPVPRGAYRVTFHFPVLRVRAREVEVFDLLLEERPVLPAFDVFAEGEVRTVVTRAFEVSVDDGELDIEFMVRTKRAKVSAIEIQAIDP